MICAYVSIGIGIDIDIFSVRWTVVQYKKRNSELKAQITILRIDFTFIYDGAEENMCVVYVFARHNQSKDDLNWNFQSHIYDVLMWKRGWHPKSYSNPVTLQRKMVWVLV